MTAKSPRLYVLDNGNILADKGLFSGKPDLIPYDSSRPDDFIEFPVFTVLIDHPDGYILYDAACRPLDPNANDGRRSPFQQWFPCFADASACLPHRLEQLGISPSDIRYVVVSHLHADHAGFLDLFTEATIIVHEDEIEHVFRSYAMHKALPGYEPSHIENWLRTGLHWQKIGRKETVIALTNGIDILNLGKGHCPGLLGLRIALPVTGTILLVSDAVPTAVNYGPPIQLPSSAAVYHPNAYIRAIRTIRAYEKSTQAQVWFAHDRRQFQDLVKSTEGYYE